MIAVMGQKFCLPRVLRENTQLINWMYSVCPDNEFEIELLLPPNPLKSEQISITPEFGIEKDRKVAGWNLKLNENQSFITKDNVHLEMMNIKSNNLYDGIILKCVDNDKWQVVDVCGTNIWE